MHAGADRRDAVLVECRERHLIFSDNSHVYVPEPYIISPDPFGYRISHERHTPVLLPIPAPAPDMDWPSAATLRATVNLLYSLLMYWGLEGSRTPDAVYVREYLPDRLVLSEGEPIMLPEGVRLEDGRRQGFFRAIKGRHVFSLPSTAGRECTRAFLEWMAGLPE